MADNLLDDQKSIRYGDEVLYAPLQVGGRAFHFNAIQVRFLYALQKENGNILRACEFVGQDISWATKFLQSRKFREFRNVKLANAAVRNGDLVDWWWKMGMDGAKGIRRWFSAPCALCHEENVYEETEAEMYRKDDMSMEFTCKVCMQPVTAEMHEDAYKPSREQVQFWAEIGNRLVPKVERVQHEFSKERFDFVSE